MSVPNTPSLPPYVYNGLPYWNEEIRNEIRDQYKEERLDEDAGDLLIQLNSGVEVPVDKITGKYSVIGIALSWKFDLKVDTGSN
jgi:hypothetical protein